MKQKMNCFTAANVVVFSSWKTIPAMTMMRRFSWKDALSLIVQQTSAAW